MDITETAVTMLRVAVTTCVGFLMTAFAGWLIYLYLTGSDADADKHKRRNDRCQDRSNAEPERHTKDKAEVRLPKAAERQIRRDDEYQRSVNDSVGPERHHEFRHRFRTEPDLESHARNDVVFQRPEGQLRGDPVSRRSVNDVPERRHGYQDRPNDEPESSAVLLTAVAAGAALFLGGLMTYKHCRSVDDDDDDNDERFHELRESAVPHRPVQEFCGYVRGGNYRVGGNFLPESRSNPVKRSVVPDWCEDLSLTEQLKMYHDKKLKLDDEQTKCAKELVRRYIGAIIDSVKEQIDAGRPQRANRCRIEHTGSMYEGTKFGQPDEFDIMVVIDGSEDVEGEEMTPGYARLQAWQHPHRFSRCLDGYQNINPTKMLDWFYGLVQRGVNKVSMATWSPVSLSVSRHGPAVMVNINERYGLYIDVDLVLCIQLDQTYYVAKPYRPYADEPPDWSLRCDPAMLWRQSFSVTETRMISRIDGANECRRDCLRVLKSVFRREPGLDKFTSFHLKTVLLRMCQEEDQWQSSKMGELFLDLLRRIESCLRDRRLPHFYLPELNLLDGIRRETIENMRFRIKRLINSEHERNRVFYAR
ncbi:cyclic GMP-AMP synthase-like receptor 3 [Branchiostoma floridae x Branchiostoma japonicum]